MAIVRGNSAGNAQHSGASVNLAWNHNVTSVGSSILCVFTQVISGGAVTAITYAGDPMTRHPTVYGGIMSLWYLFNPAVGVNAVQCTNAAAQFTAGVSVDYSGVDQIIPFGTEQGLLVGIPNSGPALLDEDLTTQNGWMCIDACVGSNWNAAAPVLTQGAGQTLLQSFTAWDGVNNSGRLALSEEASVGATTTMSWTGMGGCDLWGQYAVPLKPAIPYLGRPVTYSIDAWDPDQNVLDSRGRIVPRYKIQPNNWIRVIGIVSPTADFYESFYDDPGLSYIESVSYDGETDEVTIETNKGDLPEVILARLASGTTG